MSKLPVVAAREVIRIAEKQGSRSTAKREATPFICEHLTTGGLSSQCIKDAT